MSQHLQCHNFIEKLGLKTRSGPESFDRQAVAVIRMIGRQEHRQGHLSYQFDLEAMVPADDLPCGIDRFQDPRELRAHLAPSCTHTGRPSIDPALLIRMLIIGYAYGIRS